MGLLQVNFTLQKWKEPTGQRTGRTQIQEALKQNQKRAVYMSVFQELEFEAAKAARLFLCGSPLAGKTKLCQTLMRIVKGKSWLGYQIGRNAENKRSGSGVLAKR
ncbi:hypothetical protein AXG93_2587s1350 [Marchantia polymorpha subsp. ruderalis]|uniref:Uncharacterized protein n=1 Tax=Marchantia polymorpha subsp. ruderalis TaxID=1480154 RepID=A0A176WQM7_MARPO|nr:hypothetical protein AXG93_2587s1350 [Marchantia polymorpha subsp. ruderalis]